MHCANCTLALGEDHEQLKIMNNQHHGILGSNNYHCCVQLDVVHYAKLYTALGEDHEQGHELTVMNNKHHGILGYQVEFIEPQAT